MKYSDHHQSEICLSFLFVILITRNPLFPIYGGQRKENMWNAKMCGFRIEKDLNRVPSLMNL